MVKEIHIFYIIFGNGEGYCMIFACVVLAVLEEPKEACRPSPCGPYSQCREYLGYAVCSCLPGYIGAPPACRPECVVSSECALNCACVNQRCTDPCPGTCGINARCQVVNHNAICRCTPGYTGDPFVRCIPEQSKYWVKCMYHYQCNPSVYRF